MPSIHKDPRFPKGVWYASFYRADGKRVFRSTKTKNRAVATALCHALAEAERCSREGTLTQDRATELINETLRRSGQKPIVRLTLEDWIKECLESRTDASVALKKRSESVARRFVEALGPGSGGRLLETITAEDVRKFASSLKSEGRAPGTVNKIVCDVGYFFTRAVKLGKLRFNPFSGVQAEKDSKQKENSTFSPEQVAKLVSVTKGTDWQGAILFAYTSGTRLMDCTQLKWNQIDLQTGVIDFRQRKTGGRHVVGIHPDFESWLLAHVTDEAQGFVFPVLSLQKEENLSHAFNAIVDKAGIDAGQLREKRGTKGKSRRNLTFHSLRHTAASSVFNASAIKEVARRVTGHSGTSIDRYLHLDLESIRSATALIPRLPID
jgi:integrase